MATIKRCTTDGIPLVLTRILSAWRGAVSDMAVLHQRRHAGDAKRCLTAVVSLRAWVGRCRVRLCPAINSPSASSLRLAWTLPNDNALLLRASLNDGRFFYGQTGGALLPTPRPAHTPRTPHTRIPRYAPRLPMPRGGSSSLLLLGSKHLLLCWHGAVSCMLNFSLPGYDRDGGVRIPVYLPSPDLLP